MPYGSIWCTYHQLKRTKQRAFFLHFAYAFYKATNGQLFYRKNGETSCLEKMCLFAVACTHTKWLSAQLLLCKGYIKFSHWFFYVQIKTVHVLTYCAMFWYVKYVHWLAKKSYDNWPQIIGVLSQVHLIWQLAKHHRFWLDQVAGSVLAFKYESVQSVAWMIMVTIGLKQGAKKSVSIEQ